MEARDDELDLDGDSGAGETCHDGLKQATQTWQPVTFRQLLS